MAKIFFSSGLTRYTEGIESIEIDAPRVSELLDEVVRRFPALREPLSIMTVAVDGEIHHQPDYLPLTSASEVHVVPRISGGAESGRSSDK